MSHTARVCRPHGKHAAQFREEPPLPLTPLTNPSGAPPDLTYLLTRQAGAACVWHKIVCAAPPGMLRTGRPGYAHLLCFSRAHRTPAGVASVCVLLI